MHQIAGICRCIFQRFMYSCDLFWELLNTFTVLMRTRNFILCNAVKERERERERISGVLSLWCLLIREVHLWCLFPEDLQDCALQKAYEGFLTSDERKNVADSKNVKMQTERLLARTLVRTTLARCKDSINVIWNLFTVCVGNSGEPGNQSIFQANAVMRIFIGNRAPRFYTQNFVLDCGVAWAADTGGMVDPSCIRFTKNVYGKPKVELGLEFILF